MRPPFALEVQLPRARESAELSLELHALPEELPVGPEDYTGYTEVLELFCAAAEVQMFSGGRPEWGEARLKLLGRPQWDSQALVVRYRLLSKAMPPEAFLVLLALLAQGHHDMEPLDRVHLGTAFPVSQPVTQDELLGLQSPELYRPRELPFELEQPEELGRKNIVASFEFKEPMSTGLLAHMKGVLNMWDHLVALGGFDLSFKEITERLEFGKIHQIGPRSIRIAWSRFNGNAIAVNTLMGLGLHVHESGHPLAALSIE